MNESLLQSLQMSTESEVALKQLDEKGFNSIFDIVKEPLEQFCCTMEELSGEQAELIHSAACKRVEALESIHRTLRSRNEPVMQSIPKLGIAPFPQELQVAMGRSLGGAVDFDDLFDERSGAGYAEVTSIQSLFSPGRYLVELYKIAQGLHSVSSPLHIDK
ncbi:Tc toxin subunit A, partial [Pseudomonas sp. GL-B-19]|uniref:Tc toxin subunit A n=1 Tax=Pseudomonas sp. GL-B-19 TaxID=2832393 RepID=UPI001CBE33B1